MQLRASLVAIGPRVLIRTVREVDGLEYHYSYDDGLESIMVAIFGPRVLIRTIREVENHYSGAYDDGLELLKHATHLIYGSNVLTKESLHTHTHRRAAEERQSGEKAFYMDRHHEFMMRQVSREEHHAGASSHGMKLQGRFQGALPFLALV